MFAAKLAVLENGTTNGKIFLNGGWYFGAKSTDFVFRPYGFIVPINTIQ